MILKLLPGRGRAYASTFHRQPGAATGRASQRVDYFPCGDDADDADDMPISFAI